MKNLCCAFLALFLIICSPACSRKSGCPADSAQTKVDKHGEYKASKSTSGLLPSKKKYKKEKGPYKSKNKVKHKN